MTDITAAHNDRVRTLDPLLAAAPALDRSAAGYLECVDPAGEGVGAAAGVAALVEVDASSPFAVWGTLRRHTLDVRIAGSEPGVAFGRLLDGWLARIASAAAPGDAETSARIGVPSRDTAIINALLERGFAPSGVQAVRLRPRGGAAVPAPALPAELDGASVRLARLDDAPALGLLDDALLRLEDQYGGVVARTGAERMFAEAYVERLGLAPDTTWVLERDGRITGFVHVMPHDGSPEPEAPALALEGGQDLVVMYLDPSERGAGLGAAFATLAHSILDAAGTPYVMLSYAAANPRSGPFWARMGYRPLVTVWQRRPAILAV